MKYTVSIEDYGHHKSKMYHFETLKEAVAFVKKAKKIYKGFYFCLNFFT